MWMILLLLTAMSLSAHGASPEEVFSHVSPSVVVVEATQKDGRVSRGSGVVIAPGEFITNCHVIARADTVTVSRDGVAMPATYQIGNWRRDLCLLRGAHTRTLSTPIAKMASYDELRVGQKVYAIGNPKGFDLTMSQGIISSLRTLEDGSRVVQTDAAISPGSSGGGLFDENGRLVGITTMMAIDGQNLNFAVPANWIVDLLQQHGWYAEKERQQRLHETEPAPIANTRSDKGMGSKYSPVAPPNAIETQIENRKDVVVNRSSLERYGLQLSLAIGADGHYPRRAQMLGWQGTTEVSVLFSVYGTIKDVKILKSSGYDVLDTEAVAKIHRATNLPHPPDATRGREFRVTIPILFKLEIPVPPNKEVAPQN